MTATTLPSEGSLLATSTVAPSAPNGAFGAVVVAAPVGSVDPTIGVADALARRLEVPLALVDGEADAERLVLEARRANGVVCVPSSGGGRLSAIRPTLADELLERTCPVVAVGPNLGVLASSVPSVGVLAWVDGSDGDRVVVAAASKWARLLGEPLTLFTAVEPVPPSVTGRPPRRAFGPGDPHAHLAALASTFAPDQDVRIHVVEDPVNPLAPLRDLFEQMGSALVLAPHSGGWRRAVFGAVGSRILRFSPAPVLLVPTGTRGIEPSRRAS